MTGKLTTILTVLFAFAVLVGAKDLKIKKIPLSKQVKVASKAMPRVQEEPLFPYAVDFSTSSGVGSIQKVRSGEAARNVWVNYGSHGYGWGNTQQRSVDRFAGTDRAGADVDMMFLTYRGHYDVEVIPGSGQWSLARDLAATEIDVSAGLQGGTQYTWEGNVDGLNYDDGIVEGSGARYPVAVALDVPFAIFNQYVADLFPAGNPAYSHPYLITDYGDGYGDNGGSWTKPDFLMDDGWLDPGVTDENRLWNGPAIVVKDPDDVYRYLAVYETWYTSDENSGTTKHIFTAKSDVDYPQWWTRSWEDTPASDPIWIDTTEVWLPRCTVHMNNNGFGVIAGPGHLGGSDPDLDYYYTGTKICWSTTSDYGLTWTDWDTVSLTALGIPSYIHGEDKWIIEDIQGTDTTWYDGPAFVGMNFDMNAMVDDNNSIYVVFNSLWGSLADEGWYPNYRYSGVLLAKKNPGQDWGGARIAYNNGIWEGDDYISGMSNYFFDTECQISMDESGNVYAAWLDRRHNDVQVSQFAKYADPDDNSGTIYNDFKTDIYASHSVNGGQDWSEPINNTDSPALDEYELNLAVHTQNTDARGNFGKIWYAFVLADTVGADPAHDALIELRNDIYAGEADNFNPLAIEDENPVLAGSFGLQQNYPNPFNPTTKIAFTAVRSGQAELTVYNINGQEISKLYSGHVNKGASYEFNFDGSNIAAGLYFYRLQIGDHVQVKKMALVK